MREALPTRRAADTLTFKSEVLGGTSIHCTVGQYPDGRPGEIFIHGAKTGSHADGLMREWAKAASLAMQRGASIEDFAAIAERNPSGKPNTAIGEALDQILESRKSKT